MKALLWAGGVFIITALGYGFFPGHTYLQSDTQIYIPMLEHLRDPALFPRDIVALRPHLMFTVYDEAALFLRRFGSFEAVLTAQQLVFRALAVCGLILIALRFGLSVTQSFFVAAVVSLGATIVGPAVLTIEYEPVPRGFAISLIVFALGLIAQDRPFAAGAAAAIAFLYHPPTTLPFWGLAILLVFARRLKWTILAPLAIAAAMLAILAKLQPTGLETASIMRRLDPMQETLQRLRAAYSFVSTWNRNTKIDFALQALIAAFAFLATAEIRPCSAARFPVGTSRHRAPLITFFLATPRARTLGADPGVATCACDSLRFTDGRPALRGGRDESGESHRAPAMVDRRLLDADAARDGRG